MLCLLPGGPAHAFGNCLDAGYLSEFVDGLPAQACDDEYYTTIRASGSTATLRVIQLSAAGRDPLDPWIPLVEGMATAVGRATDQIGTGRLPREITVLLTPGTDAEGAHADSSRLRGGECRIVFYKLPDGAPPDEFTFTLAHEIFHCIQFETWRAAYVEEAGWWVEGSAEYFAHVAAPDSTSGQEHITAFDTSSLTQTLTEMEYENVVFFAWLGSAGPSNVGNFLTRMQPGDQNAVLAGIISDSDWGNFVESWLNGEVALPGGQLITPAPYASGNKRFTEPGEIVMTARPYQIARWGAQFPRDKLFELTHDAGTGRLKMKETVGGTAWEDPPEDINTCDGEKRYLVYLTTTGSETTGTVTVDTNEEDRGGTCCLTGKWLPDDDALSGMADFGNQFGGAAMAGAGGSMSCSYVGGGWVVAFNGDGTGAITYDGYGNQCSISSAGGGQIEITQVRSGATDFRWRVTGPGAAWLEFLDHSMSQSAVVQFGPVTQDLSGEYPGPSSDETGLAFACEGNRLTMTGMFDILPVDAGHSRIAPPPAP
jgi:hypothetical protein